MLFMYLMGFGVSLASEYTIIVGAGPSGLQPTFNGNTIDDPTIIQDAAASAGDTVMVWGTFQRDALPMDGLIWAGVRDASGATRALIIHDRELYWSNPADRPTNAQGAPATVPTYGPWQIYFNVQEEPSHQTQTGGGPVIWLHETLPHYQALRYWDLLGSGDDMSQLSCTTPGDYSILDEGILSIYRFPDSESTTAYGFGGSLRAWLLGAIAGCGTNDCEYRNLTDLYACPSMQEACEATEPTGKCFNGQCTCSVLQSFVCAYGECHDDGDPFIYQAADY